MLSSLLRAAQPIASARKTATKPRTVAQPTLFHRAQLGTWGQQFSMPQISFRDFLNHEYLDRKASGHPEQLPADVHFTILNPDYITRSPEQIRRLYRAIGTTDWENKPYRTIDELVVFTPARFTKQLIGVLASLMLKVENGRHLVDTCIALEKQVLPLIAKQHPQFTLLAQEAEETANAVMQRYFGNRLNRTASLDTQYSTLLATMNQRLAQEGEKTNDLIPSELTTHIIADDLLRNALRAQIRATISGIIENEIANHHFERLPPYPAQLRTVQMVTGGSGTGKSFLMKQAATWFEQAHGVSIKHFANISPDRYRLILLSDPSLGKDHRIHGTLTHTEARLMTREAMHSIEKDLQSRNQAVNVYIEQMYTSNDEVAFGTQHGAKLRVAITSYPPEKAIEGNLNRYQDTHKRLVPVPVILSGIQTVSRTLPDILREHEGKNIIFSLYDTYKMIHENVTFKNALIAEFNCQRNCITIHNMDGFMSFIKNTELNPNALSPENMFSDSEKTTPPFLMSEFIAKYSPLKWSLIDSKTGACYTQQTQAQNTISNRI